MDPLELERAASEGASALITIVPFVAPKEKVELAVPLKGFTAGFEAVVAANDAADAAAIAAGATPPSAEGAPAEGEAPAEGATTP